MKALVYRGPHRVAVENVEDPRIENRHDAIIRITTTNICGSDLHPYDGRAPLEEGRVMGHENTGTVMELGDAVEWIKIGDRVSVPFNIGCGTCKNCTAGLTSACLRSNPTGAAGAGYGYPGMGPYQGGQAEYLRVPWADFNLLKLPPGTSHEKDYALLSDVFPTGFHGAEMAGVSPGKSVAVFGAGPVGLMAAYSSILRGASEVFVVDMEPDRLALAGAIGATQVDLATTDVVSSIMELTHGKGVDCGIECVGYQAHDSAGHEHPELVLDNLVSVVRPTGSIGVVGVYVPQDPGAVTDEAKQGRIPFSYGSAFEKGLAIGSGQCPVKRYNRQLRDLITTGRARPSFLVSHELGLDEAPGAYESFDARAEGWTKVLLHPSAA